MYYIQSTNILWIFLKFIFKIFNFLQSIILLIDLVKHIDGIVHGGGAALDVVEEPGLVVSVGGAW